MTKHLLTEIAVLNRKGRFLRRLILEFSDEELHRLTPSPSPEVIRILLKRASNQGGFLVRKN